MEATRLILNAYIRFGDITEGVNALLSVALSRRLLLPPAAVKG